MSILKVKNLSKKYNENCGVFDLNIDLDPKDILLLLGPNGAGKTTAFRGILGLTNVEYDQADINYEDIKTNKVNCLNNTGAMVSKPVFYEYLTGYEYLEIFEHFYENVNENRINEVLNIVGLKDSKDKLISTYSTGMKQRLDLGRAIIHEPKLLILDEPFSGMDIEAKSELKIMLKKLQEKCNTGIIISSHMVGDLEKFANKAIIIYEGKTLFNGTMEHIVNSGLNLEEFYLEKINNFKVMEVK